MKRKIVQITANTEVVVALADDGTVWVTQVGANEWRRFELPPLPDAPDSLPQDESSFRVGGIVRSTTFGVCRITALPIFLDDSHGMPYESSAAYCRHATSDERAEFERQGKETKQ